MTDTQTELTQDTIAQCYEDERWLGYGLGGELKDTAVSRQASVERAVIAAANLEGLDYEGFFEFFNSKCGRWCGEDLNGARELAATAKRADRITMVRFWISEVRRLKREGLWT